MGVFCSRDPSLHFPRCVQPEGLALVYNDDREQKLKGESENIWAIRD